MRVISAAAALAALSFAAPPAHAEEPSPLGDPREVVQDLDAWGMPALTDADMGAIRPYLNARTASFADWLPGDRGMLIRTRFAETDQVHLVARPGGARRQLTFDEEPISAAVWATWRGRDGVFYLKDAGGAEGYQLYFFDREAGSHAAVTEPPGRAVGLRLSADRRYLVFADTSRNEVDYDLYRMDLAADRSPRRFFEGGGLWLPTDVAPDGEAVLALRYVSANEASVHLVDADGQAAELAPADDDRTYTGGGRFTRDGRYALLVSDRWTGVRQLGRFDLRGGELVELTREIGWDVEDLAVDPSGRRVAYIVNEGGRSRLHVRELDGWAPVEVPALPMATVRGLAFDDAGDRLALSVSGPKTPGDVYVLGLGSDTPTLRQWTHSEVGGLDPARFVAPTLVDYPTFDEVDGGPRRVPAYYFRPEGDGPFPVVVVIHGGPESQWRPRFAATYQHWVRDLGVAVIAPNVRGSSGYGRDYLLLDNGRRREDAVKDIGALLDWIAERGELDRRRVCVYGGSYGGYMVLASLARFPERLRCGAEIVGISNFVTFLERTKPYRRDLRRAEYGDERDPEMRAFLERISPTAMADRITAPLLVAQGANDPRVPVGESEQIVRALAARGVPTWYVLAHDEGHGFRKKKNRDVYYAALARFWREHLLPPVDERGE